MKLTVLLPGSGFPKLRSAVTLLESDGRRILVDSGLIEDGDKLVAALADRGLSVKDIDTIITTHLHYDHCGNHLLFPNAKFIAGIRDFADTHDFIAHYHADTTPDKTATAELLRSKNASIKDFYVRSIVREVTRNIAFFDTVIARDPRFELIADDKPMWVTRDVQIIPSPGHTPGHISVVAHGESPILIGGDAISLDPNGDKHLAWNPTLYKQTRESLLARYDQVIPGHGTLMTTNRQPIRVVVTGIGVLTSNASSAKEFAIALREGRSGIRDITRFDTGFAFKLGGEVRDLSSDDSLDRVSQLALTAAQQAVADSALDTNGEWRNTAGLCVGTSRGPAVSLEQFLSARIAAEKLALSEEIPFHSIARNIARRLELGGPATTVTMACVSSSLAIGRAFDAIRRGRANVMLAGGADSLTNLSFSGFSMLRAMTKSVCRPFDRRRDGIVLGEGAGILVLESYEHAVARGAKIYAEISGWGTAGDAHHATSPAPDGRGLVSAIGRALHQAQVSPDDIGHVNLHGTGTQANDPAESSAIHTVFGERAPRIPVNSLKPMFGHTLGAAGVLELTGSILAMQGGFVPPTLNSEELDPECQLNLVRGTSLTHDYDVLLSTKSAFGGANVAIVAKKCGTPASSPAGPATSSSPSTETI